MKTQSGFTLIEMVVVIIILAIMAATAMPRFVNLTGEARLSALNGMYGAVGSARNLAKSKWTLALSANLVTVDMGGTFVSVVSSGRNQASQGSPVSNYTSGMWAALENPTGFSSQVNLASGLILWPAGVTQSRACNLWYSAGQTNLNVSGGNANSDSCL